MRLAWLAFAAVAAAADYRVKSVDIRILSTMLSDQGLGEWGFAAIVEADGKRILFDTGNRPETVLVNAREMKVDLAGVTDVILSHNHGDHTGGLMTLRREYAKANASALSRAHVGEGIFWLRGGGPVVPWKAAYESTGARFVTYKEPVEIQPGVWLTGPVPRKHPERNYSTRGQVKRPDGTGSEDNVPEDQSLVIDTDKGLVVLAGCGHAGIINTIEHARAKVRNAPVHAAIGGFHLFGASDDSLAWTAGKLKEFGLQQFLGAHCTGIEATYRIRQLTGLSRRTCAVAGVGGGFTLREGIQPGVIGR